MQNEFTNKMIGNFNSVSDMFSFFRPSPPTLSVSEMIFKLAPAGSMDGSGIWWLGAYRVDQMLAFAEKEEIED